MDRESLKIKSEAQINERATTTNFQRIDGNHFEVNGLKMTIIRNYRDAFDELKFKARFSDILTKYDFIVGDIAADQLRLKGFYRQEQEKTGKINVIDSFEDYLYEYINFGAPYFVLENTMPIVSKTELELANRTNSNRRRKRNNSRSRNNPHENQKAEAGSEKSRDSQRKPNNRVKGKRNPSEQAIDKKPVDPTKRNHTDKKADNNQNTRRKRNNNRAEIRETRKPISNGNGIKAKDSNTTVTTNKPRNRRKRHFTIHQNDGSTENDK